MVSALGLLALIMAGGALLGVITSYANTIKPPSSALATAINDCLPQLQCAECGYPGCRPYAEAIAKNQAPINLCPPGGGQTVGRLAELLNLETLPAQETPPPTVAHIREDDCVGCTLCQPFVRQTPLSALPAKPISSFPKTVSVAPCACRLVR